MKKFETAKIEAIRFDNSFIATSGCSGVQTNEHKVADPVDGKTNYYWYWIDFLNAWVEASPSV